MIHSPQRPGARHRAATRNEPQHSRLRLRLLLAALCAAAMAACGGPGEPGTTGDAEATPPPAVNEAVDSMAPDTAPGVTTVMDEDACVLEPPEEAMACTMQFDPVCGCDGKTYGNACVARGAGVPRFEPGACPGDAE